MTTAGIIVTLLPVDMIQGPNTIAQQVMRASCFLVSMMQAVSIMTISEANFLTVCEYKARKNQKKEQTHTTGKL